MEQRDSKPKDPTEFGKEFKTTADFYNAVQQAASYIKKTLGIERIDAALVFGSGHRALAEEVENPKVIHYGDIPNFPIATNIGHGSELVFGVIHGRRVILFKGRFHLVEGYRSFYHAWLGYLVALLGCELLISTNSCGAITTKLDVGDVMVMSDHLNCSYMPFVNAPLLDNRMRTIEHQNYQKSASFAHSPEMTEFAKKCGKDVGIELMDGAYDVWVLPNFETSADIQYTKELGALVTGASTVPEQVSASSLGVKCIGLGAISNPATGTVDGWIHDPEFYILAGKKSLAGLKLIIWRALEAFPFDPSYKPNLSLTITDLTATHSLKLLQNSSFVRLNEIIQEITNRVWKYTHHAVISKVTWLMEDSIYQEYHDRVENQHQCTYVISLKSCGELRSRSYEEAQIFVNATDHGTELIIRQPYLEGMFPQEYFVLLSALKALEVEDLRIFFSATSVNGTHASLTPVSHYFNRRFYKFTNPVESSQVNYRTNSTSDQQGASLIIYEGPMIPTTTELKLAKKCQFDLYTTTNFSFMDLAQTLKFSSIQLMAVPKVEGIDFSCSNESRWVPAPDPFVSLSRKEDSVKVSHEFNVKHSVEGIFKTAEQIKGILGQVTFIMILESETYQRVSKSFQISTLVRLNLQDYTDRPRKVDILRIRMTTNSKEDILVITEMMTYQSYAPLQTLMLPLRIALLATDAKTVISCPHVYGINTSIQPGELFIVRDHANISASSPGIGPNINEYGPRFYDITHMYEHKLVNLMKEKAPKAHTGEVFWVNNSSVIDPIVFQKLQRGLSNDKVQFNGVVKNGVAELMAVHHRRGFSAELASSLRTCMLAIAPPLNSDEKSLELYENGAKNLINVLFETIKTLNQS